MVRFLLPCFLSKAQILTGWKGRNTKCTKVDHMGPGLLCTTCVRDPTHQSHHAHHAKATWPSSYYFLPLIPRRNPGSPTKHLPFSYHTEIQTICFKVCRSNNCCSSELSVNLVYSPLLVHKHLIQAANNLCEPENFRDLGLNSCTCWCSGSLAELSSKN